MSLLYCKKCDKSVEEKEALTKDNKYFYCPTCRHLLSYFGRERVYISKKAKDLPKVIDTNFNTAVAPKTFENPPDIDMNILSCEDTLKNNPHNYKAMNTLGLLYLTKKNFKLAEDWFNKSLEEQPDYLTAKLNLVNLFIELGAYEKALAELLDLKEKEPNNNFIDYNLAVIYFFQKDYVKAKQIFSDIFATMKNPKLKEKISNYLEQIELSDN